MELWNMYKQYDKIKNVYESMIERYKYLILLGSSNIIINKLNIS